MWDFVIDRLKRGAVLNPDIGLALTFGFESAHQVVLIRQIADMPPESRPEAQLRKNSLGAALKQWFTEQPRDKRMTLMGYANWARDAGYSVPWWNVAGVMAIRQPERGCSPPPRRKSSDESNYEYVRAAMTELGLNPDCHYPAEAGKPGVKREVLKHLQEHHKNIFARSAGSKIFERAWAYHLKGLREKGAPN